MNEEAKVNGDLAAFPSVEPPYAGGLSKREYFAAAALKGFLAADAEGVLTPDNASVGAVRYADALLEELARTEPKGTR